jgi:hypothetical protein
VAEQMFAALRDYQRIILDFSKVKAMLAGNLK